MNRRKHEILQRYQQGKRNFQGANLRGLSFKKENLSDADFSFADIRGTNFRGVNLTGAKFCGAKAGLQKRWVVFLLLIIFFLVGIPVFLNLLISNLILQILELSNVETPIYRFVTLIVIIIFLITLWTTFIGKRIEDSAVAIAVAIAAVVALALALVGVISGVIAGALALVVASAIAITLLGIIAGALALVVAVAVTENIAGALSIVLALVLAVIIILAETGTIAAASRIDINLFVALFQATNSSWFADRTIKGDEKYSFINNIAIAFAAIVGTSFRDANLTDTNFTNTTLKSTDFRGANITSACWRNTIKLDTIQSGDTYLKNAKVRELLRTGEGENINLDRFDLQGINLRGTNLTNASFIEANLNLVNLQDANLSRAKLVGTFLDQADLTGATLTGAFLEDWGITTRTKLDDIKCDYIYMRLPPDKRPDFLKLPPEQSLDDRVRRKPADEDKYFEEGEFAEFLKPLVNTLDLYHNQGVDPRIAAYSFEKLQRDHPEAEIKMRSMEIRGENNDKLLIRAETTSEADHSVLDKEYFNTYNELKALSPEQLRAVLAQREKDIQWFKGVLSAAVNRPGVNIENYSNQGDTKMSESSGDQIHAQEIHGAVANKEKIDGFAGSGREIYGLAGKGEIKDSKIARTIHESQEQQNLAQAAKDIQELLAQLDETYPSDTTMDRMKIATEVITQIDNNQTKAERILSAIKSGGVAAVEQLLNHPASTFVIAALEDWQKTK